LREHGVFARRSGTVSGERVPKNVAWDVPRRQKESHFIPKKDEVRGFIYDVKTGRLGEVT
jgi:hypothetical protein